MYLLEVIWGYNSIGGVALCFKRERALICHIPNNHSGLSRIEHGKFKFLRIFMFHPCIAVHAQ